MASGGSSTIRAGNTPHCLSRIARHAISFRPCQCRGLVRTTHRYEIHHYMAVTSDQNFEIKVRNDPIGSRDVARDGRLPSTILPNVELVHLICELPNVPSMLMVSF